MDRLISLIYVLVIYGMYFVRHVACAYGAICTLHALQEPWDTFVPLVFSAFGAAYYWIFCTLVSVPLLGRLLFAVALFMYFVPVAVAVVTAVLTSEGKYGLLQ